ncbi:hypothetical protein GCM10011289_35400 [Paludibacterium paludis]|uniref:Uncharacterized protein n=1 Tax=Paludibacterium paludis TaxID=1225769 RepID=A0A918UBW8_9NEIS|nr:hypothetical protein GCM10011289_35400 [Paludibacterium paludis]
MTLNGICSSSRVGVVDIGWRGTIQDNIALLMPDVHFFGMYLGLRRVINTQPSNVVKAAYGPDENKSNEPSALFANFAAMELLCNSPHGSVIGYSNIKDSCTIPQRQVNQEENEAYDEFVGVFQDGVLLAAQHWESYLKRYVVSSNELQVMALHVWTSLRKTPPDGLVNIFLHTPQHDVFGYGEIFKRNEYPSLVDILLSIILPNKRKKLIEFIRRVQWSEAIESAKGISPLHRTALLLAFRVANVIKKLYLQLKLAKRSKNA